MNYCEAMNYIEEKNKLGTVPGLENIKELLLRLDNPQNKCKCLHIAGTNGKGSIFSFVEEMLIDAGYRIGRYISPTIFTYLERFQINKSYMSEERFVEILERVSKIVESMIAEGFSSPTAFEIETAIAFLYFAEEKVDFALVECGMGGLLDATNVIDNTLISVMASISMDHMQFLGETVSEIATNKVGIIKNNSICISHPQLQEVQEVIVNDCKMKNTTLTIVDEAKIENKKYSVSGSEFSYNGKTYKIYLIGTHQITNATTALEVIFALQKVGITITEENIKNGLKNTKWIGRFTPVDNGKGPQMYVDGAHNEKAWIELKNSLNKYFTNGKFIYIIGVLGDKEYTKMIDILGETMKNVIAITPKNKRGLDKEILADLIREKGILVTTAESATEAKFIANRIAGAEDVIIICGSLSFLSEYM